MRTKLPHKLKNFRKICENARKSVNTELGSSVLSFKHWILNTEKSDCCLASSVGYGAMDLIPYSFTPLILFCVPYTLHLLPYYLSIANGAGGVGIFEFLVFQCFV